MARRWSHSDEKGFSLVEMLVALLFTGLLMAGMAQVFKSSLSTFTTSGEKLSSARRNRMATDLLYDDLNLAGMYLVDPSAPPSFSSTNPGFYILPNVAVAGAGADDPQTADQLFFYMDEPLPFEAIYDRSGSIAASGGTPTDNSSRVVEGASAPKYESSSSIHVLDCRDPVYAGMVKVGQRVAFKDLFESGLYIKTVQPSTGSKVSITFDIPDESRVTGVGANLAGKAHLDGVGMTIIKSAQAVRYSVKMKVLDPQKPAGVPCLVRDQGTYTPGGFVADPLQESVITENVAGFKVYLSCDSGRNWAGLNNATGQPYNYSGFDDGWTKGIRAELNAQLSTAGRADFKTTEGNENWFRDIPALVRLDLTTRTAVQRSEYSNTPTASLAYRNLTQSFVIVPRHFGLSMQ